VPPHYGCLHPFTVCFDQGSRHAAQKTDKPLKEQGWTHGMAVAKQRSLILVMFNCAFSNAESVQLGPCAEKE
jgi:hypothetical protein